MWSSSSTIKENPPKKSGTTAPGQLSTGRRTTVAPFRRKGTAPKERLGGRAAGPRLHTHLASPRATQQHLGPSCTCQGTGIPPPSRHMTPHNHAGLMLAARPRKRCGGHSGRAQTPEQPPCFPPPRPTRVGAGGIRTRLQPGLHGRPKDRRPSSTDGDKTAVPPRPHPDTGCPPPRPAPPRLRAHRPPPRPPRTSAAPRPSARQQYARALRRSPATRTRAAPPAGPAHRCAVPKPRPLEAAPRPEHSGAEPSRRRSFPPVAAQRSAARYRSARRGGSSGSSPGARPRLTPGKRCSIAGAGGGARLAGRARRRGERRRAARPAGAGGCHLGAGRSPRPRRAALGRRAAAALRPARDGPRADGGGRSWDRGAVRSVPSPCARPRGAFAARCCGAFWTALWVPRPYVGQSSAGPGLRPRPLAAPRVLRASRARGAERRAPNRLREDSVPIRDNSRALRTWILLSAISWRPPGRALFVPRSFEVLTG